MPAGGKSGVLVSQTPNETTISHTRQGLSRMESSVAAQAEAMATLDVAAPEAGLLDPPAHPSRRRLERASVLARALAASDLLMTIVACEIAAVVTGITTWDALAFASTAGLVFPLLMFFLGVYNVDDLRSWASGVHEAPKALVGVIGFTWPLFAAAELLEAPSPAVTAGIGAALTLILSTLARGAARAALHRATPFRQRTVIIGSGQVAGQLVDKVRIHKQS